MNEKRKTVCVDLDGVLAEYDGWKGHEHIGDPIPGAREFLQAIIELADVVVFTSRTADNDGRTYWTDKTQVESLVVVRNWLDSNAMPYTSIWVDAGKPMAAAYVDDHAVVCRPLKDEAYDYDRAFREVRALVDGKPLGGQGTFSDGKSGDDEGDIRIEIGRDGDNVRIDFGKPVAWLGFPKNEAIQFAMLILKHAGVQIQCQR